ncbi:MAG: hypothetical protein ACRD3Q_01135 [Terriglobales bacterium]
MTGTAGRSTGRRGSRLNLSALELLLLLDLLSSQPSHLRRTLGPQPVAGLRGSPGRSGSRARQVTACLGMRL